MCFQYQMKFPNANSCIVWNHSSLTLVFPHHSDKHWSRKWKDRYFHFSHISVWKVFSSSVWNCWLLPFMTCFSSVGGESNRTEMKWGEVCQWESTPGGINLSWDKSSFFSAKLTELWEHTYQGWRSVLCWVKMPERSGHLTNKRCAC